MCAEYCNALNTIMTNAIAINRIVINTIVINTMPLLAVNVLFVQLSISIEASNRLLLSLISFGSQYLTSPYKIRLYTE
ncbi:hypothetical protein B7R74_08550 [Yersinia pseudotuberculosis]|nr:hypothetical protein B7R74_08550 [Yersinia pseudotuberculosis]